MSAGPALPMDAVEFGRTVRRALAALPAVDLDGPDGATERIPLRPGTPIRRPVPQRPAGGVSEFLRAQARSVRAGPSGLSDGVRPDIVEIEFSAYDDGEGTVVTTQARAGTRTTHADSYGIGLPTGWTPQPTTPAAFEAALTEQKKAFRTRRIPAADIRRFELLQRRINDRITAENVQYVATLAGRDPVTDDDEGPAGGAGDDGTSGGALLLAGLVITARTREELGAPGPVTVDMLLRGFGGSDGSGGVDLEPPRPVHLPAGDAFRLVRFHTQPAAPGSEPLEFYEHAYLLPHDDGQRVAFLQMVTPSLAFTEPLGELFDAIATTLRVFYPDEPTTFAVPDSAAPGTDDSDTLGTASDLTATAGPARDNRT